MVEQSDKSQFRGTKAAEPNIHKTHAEITYYVTELCNLGHTAACVNNRAPGIDSV